VRDELIAAGRARPHQVLPESGWATDTIGEPDGVDRVIDLFRLSYERARRARRSRAIAAAGSESDA
jgi:hypothetical protein